MVNKIYTRAGSGGQLTASKYFEMHQLIDLSYFLTGYAGDGEIALCKELTFRLYLTLATTNVNLANALSGIEAHPVIFALLHPQGAEPATPSSTDNSEGEIEPNLDAIVTGDFGAWVLGRATRGDHTFGLEGSTYLVSREFRGRCSEKIDEENQPVFSSLLNYTDTFALTYWLGIVIPQGSGGAPANFNWTADIELTVDVKEAETFLKKLI